MELKKGMPVISKAGHDKDSWYIVYNIEENNAFLVNGANRTIDRPKKKKLKHLQPVNLTVSELENLAPEKWTNEQVKRILKCARR